MTRMVRAVIIIVAEKGEVAMVVDEVGMVATKAAEVTAIHHHKEK
jgi:hypothetical protein